MAASPSRAHIGRSSMWSLVNTLSAQGLNLAVFLVTARFVAPEAFGILAAAVLVNELFRVIVVEPVLTAVTTRPNPTDADYTTCFWVIALCSMIGAALISMAAPLLGEAMGHPGLAETVQLTAALVLTSGFARTHETRLSRSYRFRALAIRSLASIILGGIVGIALAINGFGLWSLVAQQLVTSITSLIFLWTVSTWRPGSIVSRRIARDIWRYARHVSLTGMTNYVNQQSDTFFAMTYLGPSATGFYSAAKRITGALNTAVGTSLNKVALPLFAATKRDPARQSAGFLAAVRLTSVITAPVFATLAVLSPEITTLLFDSEWITAAPLIAILCIPAFLGTIGQYNHSIMLAMDKPHWQTILTGIYAVSNVTLFVIVSHHGIIALALAFSLRSLLLYPLSVGPALHLLRIRWVTYFRTVAPALVASAVAAGVMIYVGPLIHVRNPVLNLIVVSGCGGGAYVMTIWIVAADSCRELLGLIKNLKRND